ncbi:PKD-like family lipoprotein [Sphingobacterium faecale]|uniref:DUF4374 domain-containing protein n=1 Tax=Sphingobacterium faecale TaxID=2803775 RepID=A0ABS1R3Y6_9SPHI|nr:PKD-like family lipoprotein [Sphingobacterium faecale]MBL1409431.1 hypothetical protein [Sphingobacterium faecale]
MKIKYITYVIASFYLFSSCYKDKGNYNYSAANVLEIGNIPDQIHVLGNVDTLKITPTIKSALEGEILGDNKNYSFTYAIDGSVKAGDLSYVAIDSTYPKDLNYFIKLAPKIYDVNFVVKDNRTGLETLKPFKLNVASAVSEGWMVLCNEGASERVRLDMIAVVSPTRSVQAFDLTASNGLPPITQGGRLIFLYDTQTRAKIGILTKSDGGYNLTNSTLSSGPSYNMLYEFGNKSANCMPQNIQATSSGYHVAVDGDNDVYTLYMYVAGPIYQFPVNTLTGNRKAEFKVSPYIAADPKPSNGSNSVLAYDITNKQFVNWSSGRNTMMATMENPSSNKLFDYKTGKNLVYMDATLYGNSRAYAILEKDNKYSLYGISFIPASPVGLFEQSYYAELNIPEIEKAHSFAFHSTLPYMFYAAGSKLYQYDIVSRQNKVIKDFGDENISMLKFNLFKYTVKGKTQEYYDQQYQLIVGLENKQLPAESCGKVQFYEVPPLNADLTLIKEYKGFAKVKDVTYKEITIL